MLNGLLDLIELFLYPCIVEVAVRVQTCEGLEAFFTATVIDEPLPAVSSIQYVCIPGQEAYTGRLREEQDQGAENARGNYLDTKWDAPLIVVGIGYRSVRAMCKPR